MSLLKLVASQEYVPGKGVCPVFRKLWEDRPSESELRQNHDYHVGTDESPEFVRFDKWRAAEPSREINWTTNEEGVRVNDATPCKCGAPDAWKCWSHANRKLVMGEARAMPPTEALGLSHEERERLRSAGLKVRFVAYANDPAIDKAIQTAVANAGIPTFPDGDYLQTIVDSRELREAKLRGELSEYKRRKRREKRARKDNLYVMFDGDDEAADEEEQDARTKQAIPAAWHGLPKNDPLRQPVTRYYIPNHQFRYVCAHLAEAVATYEVKSRLDHSRNVAGYIHHLLLTQIKIAKDLETSPVSSPEYQVRQQGFPHAKVDSSGSYENEEVLWRKTLNHDGKNDGVYRQNHVQNDWDAFSEGEPDVERLETNSKWDALPTPGTKEDGNA